MNPPDSTLPTQSVNTFEQLCDFNRLHAHLSNDQLSALTPLDHYTLYCETQEPSRLLLTHLMKIVSIKACKGISLLAANGSHYNWSDSDVLAIAQHACARWPLEPFPKAVIAATYAYTHQKGMSEYFLEQGAFDAAYRAHHQGWNLFEQSPPLAPSPSFTDMNKIKSTMTFNEGAFPFVARHLWPYTDSYLDLADIAIESAHASHLAAVLELIDPTPRGLNHLLMTACKFGNLDALQLLVERGADLHHFNDKQYTPLMTAAIHGQAEVMTYLLKQGADLHQLGRFGRSAAMMAATAGQAQTLRLCFSYGADYDEIDTFGHTTLALAKSSHSVACEMIIAEQEQRQDADREKQILFNTLHPITDLSDDLLIDTPGINTPLPGVRRI